MIHIYRRPKGKKEFTEAPSLKGGAKQYEISRDSLLSFFHCYCLSIFKGEMYRGTYADYFISDVTKV